MEFDSDDIDALEDAVYYAVSNGYGNVPRLNAILMRIIEYRNLRRKIFRPCRI